MKSTLDNLLGYPDNKRIVKLYYRSPLIDNEGDIQFKMFELKTNVDLMIMWSTCHHYETKGLIEKDYKIKDCKDWKIERRYSKVFETSLTIS